MRGASPPAPLGQDRVGAGQVQRGGLWAARAHRHCSGGRGGRGISARTACRSTALVFSSTTFSGMRSAGRRNTQGPAGGPFTPRPQARGPPPARLPLTLVLDEAVSCQELQRVHFEEHAVEEEVVGGGPMAGVAGEAGQDELLGAWRGQAHVAAVSLPWPTV